MVRSYTLGVVALMTDMKTSGNFTMMQSPRDSVRPVQLSCFVRTNAVNAAIAVFIKEFCIFPATIALNYILPKTLKINIHETWLSTSLEGV
jgi:hypothetical protein